MCEAILRSGEWDEVERVTLTETARPNIGAVFFFLLKLSSDLSSISDTCQRHLKGVQSPDLDKTFYVGRPALAWLGLPTQKKSSRKSERLRFFNDSQICRKMTRGRMRG